MNQNGSQKLIARLREQLSQFPDNRMPFSIYMSSCLYDVEHGYYMSHRPKVGRDGDFYTSVYVGDFMAQMISRYIVQRTAARGWQPEQVRIVEWGAGPGRLAAQLLRALYANDYTPYSYTMVEASAHHRTEAEQTLVPLLSAQTQIEWWDMAEFQRCASHSPVIFIANELLDAFPIERVRWATSQFEQAYVCWDERKDRLELIWGPASSDVIQWMKQHQIHLRNEQIYEAHISGTVWLSQVMQSMAAAEMIFIDYGDITEELTASHRMNGSLMCYRNHIASDDPFAAPGEQDLTSFVDFDVFKHVVLHTGTGECIVYPLIHQQQFLLEYGIMDLLQSHADLNPFSEVARHNRAIRQLLLSDHMSERFKVMRISKGPL
ncbi:SAM-dependent methyltransferase [Paenibacillus sp. UMB4589-SE434]|uniref:class I SAM-dependent methyltransferase n=1 Tax=Paenibacillus sp. UMB4589-SE434 TaxID=3046314 RepID=UPI0025511D40|nr:SAM-dependent methyltransferase [Paenibacillus sp. UMB4589-SE434]MDK8180957.1 SAM-dependent methyltransferase [Paenibacillus sp. UMB4589-SE434]